MLLENPEFFWVVLAFFCIAAFYSSVGFGGGSSYLAILALVFASFYEIRSTALLCNLVVVSSSCMMYLKKGHLHIRKFLPFVLMSIPLAFLGALFKLDESVFFVLLGLTLIISSIALVIQTYTHRQVRVQFEKFPPWISYIIGSVIGFLSGLVGIGGGIFLSPLLNHMRWDIPIKIAALASFFILANSISGITGLVVSGTFDVPWDKAGLLFFAVLLGGQLGVRFSLKKFNANSIRLITAVLVFIVGIRILVSNGFNISVFT
ncbi:MAG: sulfite exporter TauE/SafE family protein [Flavobacteriaceae bacterium]|nr:sulfite exporter TauE/SafE family protein [Flavobacteriaceae bacterium]